MASCTSTYPCNLLLGASWCQYTIRALSRTMSKPTKQSLMCLRHLALYLLGCVDHCLLLTYKGHHGLLRHTPEDYTLEVFSDSDWAKHKQTRKSVSSGFICLSGNVLYSSSRSQKALALSSAEAEIYAATSARCDGVLLFHCLVFILGGDDAEVKLTVNMDNSAGKSFLHRSVGGRIRHISVRVLWMQQKVRDKMISPSKVSTRENVSDLGAKRLTRDRVLYLMYLCKIYDMSTSASVGADVYDKVCQEDAMKQGIHMFKEHGFHVKDSKNLMRILLISALGRPSVAMAVATSSIESFSSLTPMAGSGYGWFVPLLFTVLCLAAGMCIYLRFQFGILRRESLPGRSKMLAPLSLIALSVSVKITKKGVDVTWTLNFAK